MQTNNAKALSNNALQWLRSILTERLGIDLELKHFTINEHRAFSRLTVPGQPNEIRIISNNEIFEQPSNDIPCAYWNPASAGLTGVLAQPLPAPGLKDSEPILIESSPNKIEIYYDLLGLIYWQLTRLEEINVAPKGSHNRYSCNQSHAYRHGYLSRPIVDEWIDILRQLIERMWPQLSIKTPFFQLSPSHDVDFPSCYGFCSKKAMIRRALSRLVNERDYLSLAQAIQVRTNNSQAQLSSMDPFNTFNWIMSTSERNGLVSAFYFMAGRTNLLMDGDYELDHPAILNLLQAIHSRGHEIGLHPSYETYLDAHAIEAEARRLIGVCNSIGIQQEHWGGRMHYLRWQQPTTLLGWNAAGLRYDGTLGYAEQPGFRCGTCHEYPAFDPVSDKQLELRLRPLIVMDQTIISDQYLGLGLGEAAREKILYYKNICRAVGGIFSLLWHNSQLASAPAKRLYIECIQG